MASMRCSRWLMLLVAALCILSATVAWSDAVLQHKYGLLQQLLTNVTRYTLASALLVVNIHSLTSSMRFCMRPFFPKFRSQASGHAALLRDPETITSTPFFQQLTSQERGQLLLQAGRLHLLGDLATPTNVSIAGQLLHVSADEFGNPESQFLLGALLASQDGDHEVQSVLYHNFGARGGSVAASMALGYRHLHGYGVPKSCEAALRHYKFAADRVINSQSSSQPVQVFSSPAPFKLSDSSSSKRQRPPAHAGEDAHRMEYLRQRAHSSSDPALLVKAASVVLFSDLDQATLSTNEDQDHEQLTSARNLEAKALLDRAVGLGSFSAKALLAHVYAYGLSGFGQDVPQAIKLYEEALNESAVVNATSAEAANGLGLIYFHGVGETRVDYERAMRLFKVSARKGHADGVYNTGVLLSEAHPQRAQEYLEASAHVGHLKAQFKLAQLKEKARFSASKTHLQRRTAGSCEEIVGLYKQVAENVQVGTDLLESAAAAFFFANDWPRALELYLVAAEMGYEVAESNAAWLLERQQAPNKQLYAKLVGRGVAQDSPDAHVRYGDLLFAESNFALAMLQYELADYLSHGKHGCALFSMAYMHEKGLGVVSRSLEQASLYYELVASAEPAMKEVIWLIRLKLKAQSHVEKIITAVRSLVKRVCGVVEPLTPQSHESHGPAMDEPEPRRQPDLPKSLVKSEIEQPAQGDAVTFASALRFTEDSKLQVEVPQSPESVTVETWIKTQRASSSQRTHMVLLDLQDTYTLEFTTSTTSEEQWLLQFRTESALFVFVNGPLTVGQWYHIAIVLSAQRDSEPTISLLVDGELRQQLEFFPSWWSQVHELPSSDSRQPQILSVGSSLTRSPSSFESSQFLGSLMHFRVWKSVESVASMRQLMLTQQHELDHANLLVELHFQIQRQALDESSKVTTLARTTSELKSNARIYAAASIEPELVQFPPTQN